MFYLWTNGRSIQKISFFLNFGLEKLKYLEVGESREKMIIYGSGGVFVER